MKIMRKVICVVLCLVLVFLITACGTEFSQEESQTIVFSRRFLGIADAYPEDWMEQINNLGADQYLEFYINEDGESMTMVITPQQREFWLSIVEKGLGNLKRGINGVNSAYKIEYSEDYTHMDVYYNLDLSIADAGYYVVKTDVFCIFGQLLNGVQEEDWFVSVNIYNSDTGKLVTSGDSETGLYYDTDDWEASQ